MARSSGTYSLPVGQPIVNRTVIDATVFNTLTTDIANELTNSLPRDGTAPPTANLPMGNFKITGLGNGTVATDAAAFGQIVTTATGITNTPAGNIAAVTVQAAINELDTEKAKLGANSDITSLAGLTTPLSVAQGGTGTTTAQVISSKIQPITASVATNALTLTLNATSLDFRSSTLTSGTVNTRTIASPISLVISSGSTLGTINAIQSRIVVIAIDNAGTVELAAVNIAGGTNLDETGLITTVAEGGAGAADSATVVYSTTARTGVPYRVVGYVESTQSTAGTWVTAPSTIQGYGGQALAAMSSLGYGQTWQLVTGSRALGTTYYNTTGKPITVLISVTNSTSNLTVTLGGVAFGQIFGGSGFTSPITFIVPSSQSYLLTNVSGATLFAWSELR